MNVPFLDVRAGYVELKDALDAAVARVLDGGWYVLGDEVEAFEQAWAAYLGVRECSGVGNGLDALTLGLKALDVGPGDEVIVPAHTFIATWLAVDAAGATPVPVDADPVTLNLDLGAVEAAITPRTRVLLPVHLYGHPMDLDALCAIADRHGLRVLEDAAQAHGARYRGVPVGGHGDLVAWSFYPAKNLGAFGDGGAVTTNDAELAQRVRRLRNYGERVKYEHEVRGVNSRLDAIQAAVLRVKLEVLDDWNTRRAAVAARYLDALGAADVGLPRVEEWAQPSWHLFVIRHPERDALKAKLAERGIETHVHYPYPPHRQAAYADRGCATLSLPVSERLSGEVLSLPIGPHMSCAQVEAVIDALT
jgi:dTDP-4-amino-4,6-dideoxygalactose transaminase